METTGIRPTLDRVISFSAIKYVKQGAVFKEIDRMDMFLNPGFHIPEEASAGNGITDEMVADALAGKIEKTLPTLIQSNDTTKKTKKTKFPLAA